jgi:hypothetical protein
MTDYQIFKAGDLLAEHHAAALRTRLLSAFYRDRDFSDARR